MMLMSMVAKKEDGVSLIGNKKKMKMSDSSISAITAAAVKEPEGKAAAVKLVSKEGDGANDDMAEEMAVMPESSAKADSPSSLLVEKADTAGSTKPVLFTFHFN